MEGGDEIILTGEYKDLKLGMKFDLSKAEPKDVASALAFISSNIEPHAYRLAGIDTKKIEELAKVQGKGLGAVASFLESNPAGVIREGLAKAVSRPELLPAAESYLFKRLLEKAGVRFKVTAEGAMKPDSEKNGDFIGFIGKYREWISIKKLGLEKVQDYEVSGILAGINHTAVNKAFDFAGVKKDDAAVQAAVGGKRKSYGNAAACLKELGQKLSGGPEDPYLVCKVLENLGYKPYASPDMLTEAYPDIKPPKVKGRKPKG
jgi:hypothetical protein